MNNIDTDNSDLYEITISAADSIDAELMNSFYTEEKIIKQIQNDKKELETYLSK